MIMFDSNVQNLIVTLALMNPDTPMSKHNIYISTVNLKMNLYIRGVVHTFMNKSI